MRTLIVDDEPLAIERMQILCARIPALQVVGTAADGAAALRLVEALAPDLVMLDMTMPELDGLGVARALARQTPRPAVIFVTAHDHFAVEAFDCEAVDYVLKPVAQDRLERAVERALARKTSGSDGDTGAPATPPPAPSPAPSPADMPAVPRRGSRNSGCPIAANWSAWLPPTSTASMPSATMCGSMSASAAT
jgi:two-component system response regulator AlgR